MKRNLLILTIFITIVFGISAQDYPINFSIDLWSVYNAENKKIDLDTIVYKENKSLRLKENEIALLQKIEYDNFKLDVDMAGKGMAGIGFHSQDLYNYEFIYFRTSAVPSESSIQYVPLYNGSTGWQLYNPPEYEKNCNISENEWFHVTLVVKNKNLTLYINNSQSLEIEIKMLRSDLLKGNILLKSEFSPFYYANLKIEKFDNVAFTPEKQRISNQHLNNWLMSEQFVLNEGWLFWSSKSFLNSIKGWQLIKADRNGLINLSKYFNHPKESVAVKTIIEAEMKTSKQLLFDYTHTLVLILNSDIVFYGKEMDNYGYIYDEEQKIDISLQEGENELIFIINGDAELYGDGVLYQGRKQSANWGFIAKLNDYEGIKIK